MPQETQKNSGLQPLRDAHAVRAILMQPALESARVPEPPVPDRLYSKLTFHLGPDAIRSPQLRAPCARPRRRPAFPRRLALRPRHPCRSLALAAPQSRSPGPHRHCRSLLPRRAPRPAHRMAPARCPLAAARRMVRTHAALPLARAHRRRALQRPSPHRRGNRHRRRPHPRRDRAKSRRALRLIPHPARRSPRLHHRAGHRRL